jgi:hypothetical protein
MTTQLVDRVASLKHQLGKLSCAAGLVISLSASWPSAKLWPVGWDALEQWGDDVVRSEPLTGGAGVNGVWSVRVNGQLAVGRLGHRSDADLAWETDLATPTQATSA